jgi:hypothetical protein
MNRFVTRDSSTRLGPRVVAVIASPSACGIEAEVNVEVPGADVNVSPTSSDF